MAYIPKDKRKKILILSDDLRTHSGVGTMTKEIVRQTCGTFNYVQLGAAINHPDHGKLFDLSKDFEKETPYTDISVKLYANNGYGDANVLRQIILREEPDAIMIYTDPRYWMWLFQIEYELRRKLPLFYYNIWDNNPPPFYNKSYYISCDLLMNISKQTHNLVKIVLGEENYYDLSMTNNIDDIDLNNLKHKNIVSYVPHGINTNVYKPLSQKEITSSKIYNVLKDYMNLKKDDYIFFINNRNIRRKKLSDIIIAFDEFSKKYDYDKKFKLLLHTDPIDQNGTSLPEVKKQLASNSPIYFSSKKINETELNVLYNIASATINIAYAEGFGLTSAESLATGTPIIVAVTGGLQDQCGFKNENGEYLTIEDYNNDFQTNAIGKYKEHGEWVFPIFPSVRTLVGSIPTPYIYDDHINTEDLKNVFDTIVKSYSKEKLNEIGGLGREFILKPEIGMSAEEMGERFIKSMTIAINAFVPRLKYEIEKI